MTSEIELMKEQLQKEFEESVNKEDGTDDYRLGIFRGFNLGVSLAQKETEYYKEKYEQLLDSLEANKDNDKKEFLDLIDKHFDKHLLPYREELKKLVEAKK